MVDSLVVWDDASSFHWRFAAVVVIIIVIAPFSPMMTAPASSWDDVVFRVWGYFGSVVGARFGLGGWLAEGDGGSRVFLGFCYRLLVERRWMGAMFALDQASFLRAGERGSDMSD
jgi:hypothetical protein